MRFLAKLLPGLALALGLAGIQPAEAKAPEPGLSVIPVGDWHGHRGWGPPHGRGWRRGPPHGYYYAPRPRVYYPPPRVYYPPPRVYYPPPPRYYAPQPGVGFYFRF